MSAKKKIYDKGRVEGAFTPLRHEVLNSAAWKHTSPGARWLYVALLRRLSFTGYNDGHVYLSARRASEELGTHRNSIGIWYSELEHYGFIVMTEPGRLGPKGKAAHYRITDWGWGELDGKPLTATKDYLKWDGALFQTRGQKNKIVCTANVTPLHTKCATPVTTSVPLQSRSVTPTRTYTGQSECTANVTYLDIPSPSGEIGSTARTNPSPALRRSVRQLMGSAAHISSKAVFQCGPVFPINYPSFAGRGAKQGIENAD